MKSEVRFSFVLGAELMVRSCFWCTSPRGTFSGSKQQKASNVSYQGSSCLPSVRKRVLLCELNVSASAVTISSVLHQSDFLLLKYSTTTFRRKRSIISSDCWIPAGKPKPSRNLRVCKLYGSEWTDTGIQRIRSGN